MIEDVKIGAGITITSAPTCYLCESSGKQLYQNIEDLVFGSPGLWSFRQCSNSSCGLIWMDPVPVVGDTAKLYESYYTHGDGQVRGTSKFRRALRFIRDCYLADRYGYRELAPVFCRPIGWMLYLFPSTRARINFDIMCLQVYPGGNLLEIGCGAGAFLARMRDLGWNVCGVDPDPVAVSSRRQTDLDIRCGTLEEMRFPADSFDVVTMNHVIEHVHDPVRLLEECQRVLRPGGKLVLTTPNANSWGHKFFAKDWRGLEPPRHFNIFSLHNLEECTKRSNFHTFALRSISRWGRNIFLASKAIKRREKSGRPAGVWMWLQGHLFQTLESIAEQFSVWAGEEIYFIGHKPRTQG
jgi:2-polyprenyl-3-methyl-5-hydroxy-6-metoxy-1,4-benzoquinol methylase